MLTSVLLLGALLAAPGPASDGPGGYVRPEPGSLARVLDAAWQVQLVSPPEAGLEPRPVQVQAPWIGLDGAVAYAATGAGDLHAFWLSSGKPLFLRRGLGSFGRGFGQHRDRLIVGLNGDVAALDAYSGKVAWRLPVGGEVGAGMVVTGTVAIVNVRPSAFVAVDLVKGELLWRSKRPRSEGITVRGEAPPTLDRARGLVYLGHGDGSVTAVDLAAGRTRWVASLGKQGDLFTDVDAAPLLVEGGRVLLAASYNGGLHGLEPETGRVLFRNERALQIVGLTPVKGQPELVVATAGTREALGLDPRTGTIRWRFRLKDGVPTAPQDIGDGRVVFGVSSGPLVVLEASTGRPLRASNPGSGILATPAVRGRSIVALTAAGRLIAYRHLPGVLSQP